MYRSIRPTHLARAAAASTTPSVLVSRVPGSRRLASTASSASKRTWKGAAARWGLAGAALYWYNTSPIFAEDVYPTTKSQSPLAAAAENATSTDPSATGASSPVPQENFRTVDSLLEEKQREASRRAAAEKKAADDKKAAEAPAEGSAEALEAEAGQQGAFNPETGEINWDCPCLGGMAHGPCGEDFKAAFSCFVFSTEEPKGMDCIEKFQHMQDCFRKYPEIYGSELQDDEEEGAEGAAPAAAPASGDVTDDKPANGAPTKAQIAEKLAENKEAKEEAKKEAKKDTKEAKVGAPTSTPPVDIKDDVVQAEITEDKPKTDKKKKAKKAKKSETTEKTEKTESVPTAATDATDAAPAPATPEPAAPVPAPATPASPAPPAAGDGLPKAAFDATSANQ